MKIIKVLLLALTGLVLTACAAQPTSAAVQVPDALKLALGGLVLAGVTAGLQVVFEWVGLDLRNLGAGLATAISGFAILQLQGVIDVIPAQYDVLVGIGLNVLVVILAGLGYVRLLVAPERARQLFVPRFK